MNRETRRKADFDVKKYITSSNAIEGIHSEEEDAQSLIAWAFIDSWKIIRHQEIMALQNLITKNQTDLKDNQRGNYRGMYNNDTNVTVGGRIAPDHSLVPDLMNGWLRDVTEMTPLVAHIRFESIHPFVDGNGRTGRMLYWYICKRRGIKPNRYNADTQKDREHYYRLFDNDNVVKLSNMGWIIKPEDMVKKK